MPRNNALNTGQLDDGQLLIGRTNDAPVVANITAGSGISVTNGAGAITIAAAGGGGRLLNVRYFTSGSGTYTPTSGTVSCYLIACGAGGGGSGLASGGSSYVASGGGGGGCIGFKFYSTAPTSASYSVGTGGAGATSGNTVGSAGTATTFNGDINLGGGGGASSTTAGAGGVVLSGDTCDFIITGARGVSGYSGISDSLNGMRTVYGGTGLFGATSAFPSGPNDSGNPSSNAGAGGPGGSRSGSTGPLAGGDGANGIIIVYEYGS